MGDPHTFSLQCPVVNIQLSPGNSPSALGKYEITCSVLCFFPDSFSKKMSILQSIMFYLAVVRRAHIAPAA